jgi:hypothetical protein
MLLILTHINTEFLLLTSINKCGIVLEKWKRSEEYVS